jgi:hypothetical protein
MISSAPFAAPERSGFMVIHETGCDEFSWKAAAIPVPRIRQAVRDTGLD